MDEDLISLRGPIELEGSRLVIRIPLDEGGCDLHLVCDQISEIDGDDLVGQQVDAGHIEAQRRGRRATDCDRHGLGGVGRGEAAGTGAVGGGAGASAERLGGSGLTVNVGGSSADTWLIGAIFWPITLIAA